MDKPLHQLEIGLSGRISQAPATLLHEEVLAPQFEYEMEYLLSCYLQIEKVLLLEYSRMSLISAEEAEEIGRLLDSITPETLLANPQENMSDISFAIERYIEQQKSLPVYAWHVDRSRNDFQACAQLIFGRKQLLDLGEFLLDFASTVDRLAARTIHMPMPGYTHYQSAQIITPGFYFAAMLEQVLDVNKRLLAVYDGINRCPLGSGAMAGQELPWDRERMARLLGFASEQRHALVGVASRDWVLRSANELGAFSVNLSRFVTDLIQWGSSEYGFIDLPDSLSGISSAMPQKKNFPILERIRGKSAHVSAFALDFMMGQRSTAYTNLVETSKEAGTHVITMFRTVRSMLTLLGSVLEHLSFREDRMRESCERDYFGGFALANLLTLQGGIPYRQAQVLAGRYITACIDRQLKPSQAQPDILVEVCAEHGYVVNLTRDQLSSAFDVEKNILGKVSSGSTHPDRMLQLLDTQRQEASHLRQEWEARANAIQSGSARIQDLLYSQNA